jgi:hypothetical protein
LFETRKICGSDASEFQTKTIIHSIVPLKTAFSFHQKYACYFSSFINLIYFVSHTFNCYMHHSFVEALLRYLINENDLSKNPNWRRSAFNALFLAVLHHMCRLKNACAHPTSQSVVVPFSRQDFVHVFCYEFTHWRCGREDGDTSKTPIVWDTQQSRMLSMDTFGVSRVITISDSGSIPIAEPVVEADRSHVLS